ncbi:MAG: class I SAM-dependent methyltransferase [Ruminococcaceae bacterium]|nr:class I SAM-dependent methyltransferase [Oscillospiraceae bacterium]
MNAYETLSAAYDGLTRDIDYKRILDFLEAILRRHDKHPTSVLDLGCGTGSMSVLMANAGYQVIGADLSEEMLTIASQKAAHCENRPFFIRQPMQKLRLPMKVDAVFCLLDSLNYVTDPQDVRETMRRVYRNLSDGGVFIFDINTPHKLRAIDGQVFLDENEDSYCVWRVDFDVEENCCYYGIDLFRKQGALWQRSFEQHCEYAYEPSELTQWLQEAGFNKIVQFGDCSLEAPKSDEQRIYFLAWKE